MTNDDRDVRALAALRAAYEDTALPEAARRRIVRGVFGARRGRRWVPPLVLAGGLAAAGAIAFVCIARRPATPPPEAAVVREFEGVVRIADPAGEGPVPARDDMSVPTPSAVETGAGARLVLGVGGHEITLLDGGRLELRRLDPGSMRFEVERGRAHFEVARLGPDERFSVKADGLVVEVVGTSFDVFLDDDCPGVSVAEGRVRATFDGDSAAVEAGETRRFCAPSVDEKAILAPVRTAPPAHAALPSSTPSTVSTPSTGQSQQAPQPPRPIPEEERLYREALDSRVRGDLALASAQTADYLDRYPQGAFAEEALFSLVRLGYRRHDLAEVRSRGAEYVGRYPGRGAKADEVRILLAEARQRRGDDRGAFEALAPLVADIDSVAAPYREQLLRLCGETAPSAGREDVAARCAAEISEMKGR